MKLHRNGATRIVLLIGPWAIKVPVIHRGWRPGMFGIVANIREHDAYRAIRCPGAHWHQHWPHLMPVLWCWGGLVLVMRRGEPVPVDRASRWIKAHSHWAQEFCGDLKPCNLVVYRGMVRLCDYA